jgi:hypothetical protein
MQINASQALASALTQVSAIFDSDQPDPRLDRVICFIRNARRAGRYRPELSEG